MSIILKNCPFCGHPANYFKSSSRTCGYGESEDTVGVCCTNCSANISIINYTGVTGREDTAAIEWNRRIK